MASIERQTFCLANARDSGFPPPSGAVIVRPSLGLGAIPTREEPTRIRVNGPIQRTYGRETMHRLMSILALGACTGMLALTPPTRAAEMALPRFECGTPQEPVAVNPRFSDIFAYGDMRRQFVYSCYLVKHGDDYLLWDSGHAMTTPKVAPKVSLVDLLAKINVK